MTIYNYKDGINYRGLLGIPVEQITHWHVGGHGFDVDVIADFLAYHGFELSPA